MLAELRFVQGAVAKKDFLPAMTHFVIENNTVRAYNGMIALCAPVQLDGIACKPKADKFVQAIDKCPDGSTPVLVMTKAGRLSVKAGAFSASVDCVDEETPHVLPEGERLELTEKCGERTVKKMVEGKETEVIVPITLGDRLLEGFKAVHPFIGDDASRPWSNGVLLREESVFATNNVMLVQYWIKARFPITVNVPRIAIREMLRINEPPTHAQFDQNSITFHFANKKWIRSQLFETQWPDLGKVLDQSCDATSINSKIFDGLEAIRPFVDKMGRVFIRDGKLSTVPKEKEGEAHAEYEIDGLAMEGIYSIEMLHLLKETITKADFTTYPRPCLFFGGNDLRGAIIGMRP